jgi:hypothetical protein
MSSAYTNVPCFLTFWVFLIVIVHAFVDISQYIDVFYLGLIVFIMGLYVSFVDPGYYTFTLGEEKYKLTGLRRFCIVDLIHILIFMMCIHFYKQPSLMTTTRSILLVFLYVVAVNTKELYHVQNQQALLILGVAISLLYILWVIKSQ